MTKHTQGPWVATEGSPFLDGGYIVLTDDMMIAHVENWEENEDESLANAALIAAAPDLLEALEDTLWGIKKFKERTGLDLERSYPVLFDHLTRARNAIAKARGE